MLFRSVVNKADLPGADAAEKALLTMLKVSSRGGGRSVLRTCATSGQGIRELADWLLGRA